MRDSLSKALAVLAAFALGSPALADTGPCKPYPPREILMCGSGDGAAIVIRDTTSPDKKFALAWRDPKASPLDEPEGNLDLLVLRLSDGAILAQSTTEYWDTGEMHSNHPSESAYWSPDSKYLVRSFSYRYGSDMLELYAVDNREGAISGPYNLLKVLDAPLRAKLKPRLQNMEPDDFTFILAGMDDNKPAVRADANGNIRMEVTFWRMKNGPSYYYTVNLKVAREKGELSARIVSMDYRGMEKADE